MFIIVKITKTCCLFYLVLPTVPFSFFFQNNSVDRTPASVIFGTNIIAKFRNKTEIVFCAYSVRY